MKAIRLSEKQQAKLSKAMEAVQEAQQELARRQAELQNIVELVFDAHGAPENAQIDPRTWMLLVPEESDSKSDGSDAVEPWDEAAPGAASEAAPEGESGESA